MDDLNNPHYKLTKSVYDFKVRDNFGQIVPLKQYEGYVNIFVNVSAKSRFTEYMCGLLNEAYAGFETKGLRILAFPCDQFDAGESVCREEVRRQFKGIGARFHLFDTIHVNGCHCHHLYRYIKKELPNEKSHLGVVKTNYTLFIFDKKGRPIIRLEPPVQKCILFHHLTQLLGDPVAIETEKLEVKSWKKRMENELTQEISVTAKLSQKSKILDECHKAISENLSSQRIENIEAAPNTRKSVQIASKSKILHSEQNVTL